MLEPRNGAYRDYFRSKFEPFWKLSGEKILSIERTFDPAQGTPVFTARGTYTTRGWTEWTQGFLFGSALLQFEATDDQSFLEYGKTRTLGYMAPHLTNTGVHDHGFNNVSTYGNLLRLLNSGKIRDAGYERNFYELALKVSGAVQASRWTSLPRGEGYVYSFNGPHSLFVDTVRSLRALALSWKLGHVLLTENDEKVDLLGRLITHLRTTAGYSVYYGEGRDSYDVRGRVAHESVFNVNDGKYRCPSSQQGYSPFSTWTRGLAWIILGYAEEAEFLRSLPPEELETRDPGIMETVEKVLFATCDFYLANTPSDGIPYWDTGAPGLLELGDYLETPADPFNGFEPVDSSAAAIACQGLMRFGRYLRSSGRTEGDRYFVAGLSVLARLLEEPYLSTARDHQGLLLHSVYHRPNGWDYVPEGARIPFGESSMWGDYHLREAVLYVQKLFGERPGYLTFWSENEHDDR